MNSQDFLHLVDNASNIAISKFFNKIGIQGNVLNCLNNTGIVIDKTIESDGLNAYGSYSSTEDLITIDSDYLNEKIKSINDGNNRYEVMKDVLETMVHEKVHALRRIHTPDNIINLKYFDAYTMVRELIVLDYGDDFNYVVPCDVILEESIHSLDSDSLIQRKDQQIFLEEIITEAFAKIIVYNYSLKDQSIPLIDVIKDSVSMRDNEAYLGAMIISNLGIDTIKWFLSTRVSNEPYHDVIAEQFGEEYDSLLSTLSSMTNAQNKKEFDIEFEKLCRTLINNQKRR